MAVSKGPSEARFVPSEERLIHAVEATNIDLASCGCSLNLSSLSSQNFLVSLKPEQNANLVNIEFIDGTIACYLSDGGLRHQVGDRLPLSSVTDDQLYYQMAVIAEMLTGSSS